MITQPTRKTFILAAHHWYRTGYTSKHGFEVLRPATSEVPAFLSSMIGLQDNTSYTVEKGANGRYFIVHELTRPMDLRKVTQMMFNER